MLSSLVHRPARHFRMASMLVTRCECVKSKVQSPTSVAAPTTNPFLVSSPSAQPILDLFATPAPVTEQPVTSTKASDDLLQLGNPFADIFSGAPTQPAPAAVPPGNMWMTNGFNNGALPASTNAFVSDTAFSSVFGAGDTATQPAGKCIYLS
ncbi:hypothetical protein J6590_018236 [Homalodisca vitripennis]|nr:hypothetical protein J6590_018236 [Homalodisca vitripennis]